MPRDRRRFTLPTRVSQQCGTIAGAWARMRWRRGCGEVGRGQLITWEDGCAKRKTLEAQCSHPGLPIHVVDRKLKFGHGRQNLHVKNVLGLCPPKDVEANPQSL